MEPEVAKGLLEPLQYIHVQLQGGAPWGFTLQGGLEHGGPLIISKVEDGGKAEKCEKIEVGDELVNINGIPLHGSRQEALILIKGSYKILRMIVRRRRTLVIRPHSWHLAKLSEVHPDVANMQYPSDAFSISWHSGSEISEHPLQWNILSRHCSTDKSSSIGSMDSLDQPGQNYYEGTISPLDPGMHQNKRDSAYSSFSASSNISDYTVSARMDVSSPINCFLGSNKQEDSRYLQTGQGAVESQVDISGQSINEHFQKVSIFPYANLDNINSPPRPPIRRDSLRENKNQFCNHDRRASAPDDSYHMPGIWSTKDGQFNSPEMTFCHCTNGRCTVHLPENVSSDQYYMLSSQTDRVHEINTCAKHEERRPNQHNELKMKWSEDERETKGFNCKNIRAVSCSIDHVATETNKDSDCEHWKPLGRFSTQANMFSLQARDDVQLKSSEDCCHFTSDKSKDESEKKCSAKKTFKIPHQKTEQLTHTSGVDLCSSSDKSARMPNEEKDALISQSNNYVGAVTSNCITNTLIQNEPGQIESVAPIKKPGSSRNRSAQMRRKSDRFATNLRNEIQRRKAQLQKNKDSKVLLSVEDSVTEEDKVFESCSEVIPPPPPPKNKALCLEVKRFNSGMRRNSKDYTHHKDEYTDDKKETHKHTIKENIEPFIEDREVLLSENKTCSEWRKSSGPDTHEQESAFRKRNEGDHKNKIQRKYSAKNIQHSIYRAPKSERLLNEWVPVSTSMPSSPDRCSTEDELSIGSLQIPVECIDSSSLEDKLPSEVCSVGTLGNSCESRQTPAESLDKQIYEDNTCYNNYQSFDSEKNWNSMQNMSDRPVTEKANLGQNKKVHEEKKFDFPSAARLSPHQFSDLENNTFNYSHNSGSKWTWSPEHKLNTDSYIGRENGRKGNGVKVEETLPLITKLNNEDTLIPFADRRMFFENVSKGPTSYSTVNDKPNKKNCPSIPDNPLSQTMVPDLRRHSVDHTHHFASARRQDSCYNHYDFCMNHTEDPQMCCNHDKHPDYLPSLTYGCRACIFCSNDLCPALLKRNIPPSCHCQHLHQHYHHRWTQCADCLCPTQYNFSEEGGPLDQWHLRKPCSQDISLKEWQQHMKINRKCSQSVSDLCHYSSGIQHPSSLRLFCEENKHDWSQCHKTTSSYDISCRNFPRPGDFSSYEDGHPGPSISRNRACSVSQLNLEYLALRDRIESPTTKLEERNPSVRPKKQGPPRPPPPKWEKYKEHQASKQTSNSGFFHCTESQLNSDIKNVIQNSQSLPVDRTYFSNLPPCTNHGFNNKEFSEMPCTAEGSQESLSACQNTLGASESKEADEHDVIEPLSCSESKTMEPLSTYVQGRECSPALEDIFEGEHRYSEDEWSTDRESEVSIPERHDEFQPISPTPSCGTVSPTMCATYQNASLAKAGLLSSMTEMTQEKAGNVTEAEHEENEFTFKKVQLIESISRKLSVLREAQQGLQEDINANATLGSELENLLRSVCKPNEYDKFRLFIGDLDKVVSLLLSLSGRLSRVENALNCEDPVPTMEEKLNLMEKKKQLTDQMEDAKELKANVTRREKNVLETLSKYLNDEQLQDYQHYVKMTSALIVEQRELEDKIRLGEEQLRCLRESL
ncbi:protein Shroom4 isoform X2 [Dendropsophus ebraccatus]|uniref:protein Shroom4 isoform X2 n=1 Tax=Dendropsophus ebraccatus TaxID=150705 RepID=UPI00383169E9